MLKAFACNLMKIANDLRLLGSGPDAGLHEVELPPRQAGSSIMAGKINPVIPEMISQIALRVMANDHVVALTASMGQLELNQILPLLTHTMMESLDMLLRSTRLFVELCINGVKANADRCMELALKSKSIATVLVPMLGYHRGGGFGEGSDRIRKNRDGYGSGKGCDHSRPDRRPPGTQTDAQTRIQQQRDL